MRREIRVNLRRLGWGLLAAGAIAAIGIALIPLPARLLKADPFTPLLLDRRGGEFVAAPGSETAEQRPISLEKMGEWFPKAIVGLEDHRFQTHRGIDPYAVAAAAVRAVKAGRIAGGASTITQQLVKISDSPSARTLGRKFYEACAATRLEMSWSKSRILEAYGNRIDFGNRRFGIAAAARAYFGKAPADLTAAEAIYLAGIPQSPHRFNPWRHPVATRNRYLRAVDRLTRVGIVSPAEATSLRAHPPAVLGPQPILSAPAFASEVLQRVRPDEAVVRTTLDPDLQRVVQGMLRQHLADSASIGARDAAIVVLENATGEIRAMAGSSRWINTATTPRSLGSTLKPFVYLAGIRDRTWTAATLLPDTAEAIKAAYADYDPRNFAKGFSGPVRVREALGNSLNVPAVVAVSRFGARRMYGELRDWGLEFAGSFADSGAGFVLGNGEASLLNLTGAYASLARGGRAWAPKALVREVAEVSEPAGPPECAIVADMLCDNAARRRSFGWSSPLNVDDARVAVKTGTSSGFRDGWCVGFTGEHTVGVWVGNLDGSPMQETLAARSAAPLWAAAIRWLLGKGDRPVADPPTESLERVEIAAETGLLPRSGEATVTEWFLPGTAPAELAANWYAEGSDPPALLLPEEYAAWCASPHNHLGARVREGPFRILVPRDGAVFSRSPELPVSQQMIEFRSAPSQRVEWRINGQPLAAGTERVLWPLQPGDWTLEARANGETARASFQVK